MHILHSFAARSIIMIFCSVLFCKCAPFKSSHLIGDRRKKCPSSEADWRTLMNNKVQRRDPWAHRQPADTRRISSRLHFWLSYWQIEGARRSYSQWGQTLLLLSPSLLRCHLQLLSEPSLIMHPFIGSPCKNTMTFQNTCTQFLVIVTVWSLMNTNTSSYVFKANSISRVHIVPLPRPDNAL